MPLSTLIIKYDPTISASIFTIRNLFIIFAIFIVAGCLYSMLSKSINAQNFDNGNQQSNYFQDFPTNNTDKNTVLILLAKLIGDKITSTVDALEISSNDESLKNVAFLKNISSDYNGIHPTLDSDKRNLAKDILQRNKDIASIFFVLPGGDIYMGEPYKDQEQLPRINFADREWYKGVVKNNQTYVSSIFLSASINGPAIAMGVPVYSLMSDLNSQSGLSSLSGYWVGIINLRSLENMFESLGSNTEDQFILIDHNGTELLNTKKSNIGPLFYSGIENKSLSPSANNMTSPVKLDTFGHFNTIKESANETSPVYDIVNLDDHTLMIWKSIKIYDSNWYAVLITKS
ncbi:hypothetical protein BH23THE1_BH23THE1_05610 [soil metagenome]